MERGRDYGHKTHLAYALEDAYEVFEVTDVEDRNDELDVGIVPHTVHGVEAAGLAEGILLRGPLWCA